MSLLLSEVAKEAFADVPAAGQAAPGAQGVSAGSGAGWSWFDLDASALGWGGTSGLAGVDVGGESAPPRLNGHTGVTQTPGTGVDPGTGWGGTGAVPWSSWGAGRFDVGAESVPSTVAPPTSGAAGGTNGAGTGGGATSGVGVSGTGGGTPVAPRLDTSPGDPLRGVALEYDPGDGTGPRAATVLGRAAGDDGFVTTDGRFVADLQVTRFAGQSVQPAASVAPAPVEGGDDDGMVVRPGKAVPNDPLKGTVIGYRVDGELRTAVVVGRSDLGGAFITENGWVGQKLVTRVDDVAVNGDGPELVIPAASAERITPDPTGSRIGDTAVQQAGRCVVGLGQGIAGTLGDAAQSAWDTAKAVVRLFNDGAFQRQVADGAARLARLDAEITAYVKSDPLGAARAAVDGAQSLYDRFQTARAQAAQDGTLAEFDGCFTGRVLTEGALAFLPLGTVAKVGQGVELSRGTELAGVAGRLAARSDRAAGLLRAEKLGVSDALSGHEGYYFRYNAGGEVPEIVRKSGDVGDQLALRPDGMGGYEVVAVSGKVVQATTTALPDGVASSITRTLDADHLLHQERQALDGALQSRTEQMAGRAPDESEDGPAYKAREQAIREASNAIGEIGAASYVRGQFRDAELVYGGPGGAGSKTGDFDQVWKQTLPDGGVRLIVVEAKGGTSSLGSAQIGDTRYIQPGDGGVLRQDRGQHGE